MKKLLLIALTLALLLTCALADTLEIAAWPGDALNVHVVLTQEAAACWSLELSEQELNAARDALVAQAVPVSFSPTGRSGLLMLGNVLLTYNQDSIRVTYPSTTRGVADEYGNLEYRLARGILSGDDVIWSPDGRYALLTNWIIWATNARYIVDPVLIDTETGELVIAATYSTKPTKGGAVLTSARFSQDGKYLYYMLSGTVYEEKCSLMRCDLETMAVERCLGLPNTALKAGMHDLVMLNDGTLMAVMFSSSNQDPNALALMTAASGEWTVDNLTFAYSRTYMDLRRLAYSSAADMAVLTGRMYALERGSATAFALMADPRDAENVSWWIILTDGTLHQLTNKEITTPNPANREYNEATLGPATVDPLPAAQIINCCFSPDGTRLLVYYASRDGQVCIAVIDPGAMEITAVKELYADAGA